MEDCSDRYGIHFVRLADSRVTMKEFEFDRMLLMPTARGYRALVEQAKVENQTARGHPALKGRGMLRAARPFFRNSEIIESSLPRFF